MKDHAKTITIILIILVAYTIFVYAYAAGKKKPGTEDKNKQTEKKEPDNTSEKTNNYDVNIALFTKHFLGYKDGVWYENPSFDFTGKSFDVYTDNTVYKSKEIVYTDRWYIMNEDRSFIDYKAGFIAVNSVINYALTDSEEADPNEAQRAVIEEFLNSKGIKYNYNTLKKSVMTFDINRDGIHDNIYVVSNLFLNDYSGYDKTFAFVFVRSLNKNNVLYEDVFDGVDAVSICDPYIYSIITIDNKNTMIIGCEYFSMGGNKFMLFTNEEKSIDKVLETKAN